MLLVLIVAFSDVFFSWCVCACTCVCCVFFLLSLQLCVFLISSLCSSFALPHLFAFLHFCISSISRALTQSWVSAIHQKQSSASHNSQQVASFLIWCSFILNIWIWYLVSICPCAFEGSWRETKVTVFSFWDALLSLYLFLWLCVFIKALKTF